MHTTKKKKILPKEKTGITFFFLNIICYVNEKKKNLKRNRRTEPNYLLLAADNLIELQLSVLKSGGKANYN